ncbi:MAG: ferritin family protein [Thermoplasmatales archaeon]|nr:ferritin family protein [Thermoplasmatales archaeon]
MEEINVALQLEKDGYAFYKKASSLCKNVYGKKMFEKLAEDEIRHLEKFRKIAKEIFGNFVEKESKSPDIFGKIDFSTTSGEYAALEYAIDFEKKAYDYFKKASENAKNSELKELFENIAKEEEMHRELLEAERNYLHKSGIWFDYQEFFMDGL